PWRRSSGRSTPRSVAWCCGAAPRCPWPTCTGTRPRATTSATCGGRRASEGGPAVCQGIALAWSALPLKLVGRHRLTGRCHGRGGEAVVPGRLPQAALPDPRDRLLRVVGPARRQAAVPLPPG